MGGDYAPGEIVVGAVEAAAGVPDVKVLLVGQLKPIQDELDKLPKDLKRSAQEAIEKGSLEIVHAPDVAEIVKKCDAAILALPHGLAAEYAVPLLEAGIKVFDISADFRRKGGGNAPNASSPPPDFRAPRK